MTTVMVTEAVTVVEVAVTVVNLTMTFCRQLVISLQYEDNAREKEIEKDDKRMGTECLRMAFSMFFCGRKLSGKKEPFLVECYVRTLHTILRRCIRTVSPSRRRRKLRNA